MTSSADHGAPTPPTLLAACRRAASRWLLAAVATWALVLAPQALAQAPGSGPAWAELSASQHRALKPLAPHWDSLTEPQKRKWIALSGNYRQMTPENQALLHSRMTEWAGLSHQQRTTARINFAEIQRLPADQRAAKWEAYQALSPEERARLAKEGRPPPRGAATVIKPLAPGKLAPVVPGR